MPAITIVIPTFNEAQNLPILAAELWSLPIENLRILVVDDASPDGTGQIADDLSKRHPGRLRVVHREGKFGLGSAYLTGFRVAMDAGADIVGQMDADFSHSPSFLPDLLDAVEQADVALGSRYVEGGEIDERWGIGRLILSSFGNFYARTILGLHVRDATGGFRLWRRETLVGMPLERIQSNGYVFQVELTYIAERLGYKLVERPIYFEERRLGQSKMSLQIQLEAALRVWQLLFRYRDLHAASTPPQ
jgi:dolichol-phosphate mannosyltransferase